MKNQELRELCPMIIDGEMFFRLGDLAKLCGRDISDVPDEFILRDHSMTVSTSEEDNVVLVDAVATEMIFSYFKEKDEAGSKDDEKDDDGESVEELVIDVLKGLIAALGKD